MNVIETALPGVVAFEPKVYGDDRGYFFELWSPAPYVAAGLPEKFAQDNVSRSKAGVVRGLHYQHPLAQGKLVTVLEGEVFDVAVDIRIGSPTFGKWVGITLSAENRRQFYIPEGFAHGFAVTKGDAIFHYKCSAPYSPGGEGSILWDDPAIGIDWPIPPGSAILSPKDAAAARLADVPEARLPRY